MRKILTVACALAIVLASLISVSHAHIPDKMAPYKAPDFTVTDTDGNAWTLSDHLGKRILISFFFCG